MIQKLVKKYKSIPVQIKASFWFLICAFMQNGVAIITTPIFTRLLSTGEYGQYSIFQSWLGIITVFVTLNLASGVYIQGLVKFEKEKSVFSSSMQGLCLLLVIIWFIIFICFKDFWTNILQLTVIQIISLLAIAWTSAIFNFWSAEQRINEKYKLLVFITLVVSVLSPLVGIFLVSHSPDKVTARIIGIAAINFIAYIGFFIIQVKRGKKIFNWKFWKYAIIFNLPLIPHYLSTSILNSSDRIMIGLLVGEREAGIYSLGYSISLLMTMFNTALLQTIEPWLYKQIKCKEFSRMSNLAYPAFLFIAAVNLVLIFFAPEIVSVFAPIEYSDAIWIIPPVAMSSYFMFSYSFFAVFEFYYEKTHFIAIATVSGAVINIILNVIFISKFGYIAAAYTTLFCFIIYALMHYYFMKKICANNLNISNIYDTKKLLLITISFMVIGFFMLVIYKFTFLRYVVLIAFLAVAILKKELIFTFIRKIIEMKKEK